MRRAARLHCAPRVQGRTAHDIWTTRDANVRTLKVAGLALALLASSHTPAWAQDTTRAGPPGTRIDFQDADLRAVITALAEAGGLNVTYGEMPSRRVTLHLPQGLTRADMLPLLRSVAASNGLRADEQRVGRLVGHDLDFALHGGTQHRRPDCCRGATPDRVDVEGRDLRGA